MKRNFRRKIYIKIYEQCNSCQYMFTSLKPCILCTAIWIIQ